ncbi:MAG: hypothetical protein ACOH1H_14850 [Brevundimonas sp.]
MAVALVAMTTALAGCGNGDAPADRSGTTPGTEILAPAPRTATPAAPTASGAEPAATAIAGAPAFAAIYPGGQVAGTPTTANGPDGPGGIVSFTTDADPETVVAWYRHEAEAAGLSSVMAMNQGEARAYGAAAADHAGTSLRVVADPVDDGSTSVQLTWSAGR